MKSVDEIKERKESIERLQKVAKYKSEMLEYAIEILNWVLEDANSDKE